MDGSLQRFGGVTAVAVTLAQHQRLMVRQRHEMGELFGLETRNKYEVVSEGGAPVAYAAEQQKGFLGFLFRQSLGHWRTFDIQFFTADRAPFMTARHPFRFFFQRLEVFDHAGVLVGAIQQRFSIFSKRFDVQDAGGQGGHGGVVAVLAAVDVPVHGARRAGRVRAEEVVGPARGSVHGQGQLRWSTSATARWTRTGAAWCWPPRCSSTCSTSRRRRRAARCPASSATSGVSARCRAQPRADARQDPIAQGRVHLHPLERLRDRLLGAVDRVGRPGRRAPRRSGAARGAPRAPRPAGAGSSASRPSRASRSSGRGSSRTPPRAWRGSEQHAEVRREVLHRDVVAQRQLDGARRQARLLRRGRARAGSGACWRDRSLTSPARADLRSAASSARRAAAVTTTSSRFGSTSPAPAPAGGGRRFSRPRRRRPDRARVSDQRAQQHRAPQAASRRPLPPAGDQPSFAARSPYSSVTSAPNAARSSSARNRCSISPSRPTTSSSTTWSSSPRRLDHQIQEALDRRLVGAHQRPLVGDQRDPLGRAQLARPPAAAAPASRRRSWSGRSRAHPRCRCTTTPAPRPPASRAPTPRAAAPAAP